MNTNLTPEEVLAQRRQREADQERHVWELEQQLAAARQTLVVLQLDTYNAEDLVRKTTGGK